MTDPHAANPEEDPERCIGEEVPDPWTPQAGDTSLREVPESPAGPAVGTAAIPDPPLFGDAARWFGAQGGGDR